MKNITIIFGLLFSVSVVCAQELQQTGNINKSSDILTNESMILNDSLKYFNANPEINESGVAPNLNVGLFRIDSNYAFFSNDNFLMVPYGYSFDNSFSGMNLAGISNRLYLGDLVTADFNLYMASSYFGYMQPNRYTNASAEMILKLRVHERVKLVGMAKVSAREGFDPRYPSLMNNANYFGGGIEFKATDKFSFGVGFTNSYYRGQWTAQPYFAPVAH